MSKIQWHPAFYSGLELELREFKNLLEYRTEYELSRKPLRMDMLIIKRLTDDVINHPIAGFFKKHNIVEYKSPMDELSIDDFYKTIAYALLYKSFGKRVNEIPVEELTVSIFRDRYPREMIQELKSEGKIIEETSPGIYRLEMDKLPVQIVVTRLLSKDDFKVLRLLTTNASIEDFNIFMRGAREYQDSDDRNNVAAVLDVSLRANDEASRALMEDETMSAEVKNYLQRAYDEQREMGKAEGKAAGIAEGMVVGKAEGKAESIKGLMKNLKMTAEQAMEALGIPKSEYKKYMTML